MKFVEAILSNNSTDDHCREFVAQKGLLPLMGILGLPNLPIDFPASPACQAVASVCKSILVSYKSVWFSFLDFQSCFHKMVSIAWLVFLQDIGLCYSIQFLQLYYVMDNLNDGEKDNLVWALFWLNLVLGGNLYLPSSLRGIIFDYSCLQSLKILQSS